MTSPDEVTEIPLVYCDENGEEKSVPLRMKPDQTIGDAIASTVPSLGLPEDMYLMAELDKSPLSKFIELHSVVGTTPSIRCSGDNIDVLIALRGKQITFRMPVGLDPSFVILTFGKRTNTSTSLDVLLRCTQRGKKLVFSVCDNANVSVSYCATKKHKSLVLQTSHAEGWEHVFVC